MHPQAREAKERLLRAGFQRQDFKVRTTRNYSKEERAAWGDYNIYPDINFDSTRVSLEQLKERTPAMQEQGLSVIWFTRRDSPAYIHVRSDGIGFFRKMPLDDTPEPHETSGYTSNK